jgi:hypothetical protein
VGAALLEYGRETALQYKDMAGIQCHSKVALSLLSVVLVLPQLLPLTPSNITSVTNLWSC